MAITTETEALIEIYNQKLSLDNKQLLQINAVQSGYTITTGIGDTAKIKIWGPNEVIENYNVPIKKLDNRIIELNTQIDNLQSQILVLGQQANSVGCGTTGIFETSPVGFTTIPVYQDVLNYKGYTFTGINPFSDIQGTLSTGNSGIGTQNYITQVSIGSYFGPIGTGEICAGYSNSITDLNNQIITIQTSRNDLINKVNFLKTARTQYELQNYAYEQSKSQLNTSIAVSDSILSFLEDPANADWL
jgi:hypothetical protein